MTLAQSNLGWIYANGAGDLQDRPRAHIWYDLVSGDGNDAGRENTDRSAAKMTAECISKAQAMARVCMESRYRDCGG